MTIPERNRKIAEAPGFREGQTGGCLQVRDHPPKWHHPKCKCDENKCTCYCEDEPSGCEGVAEDCAHLHVNECGIDLPNFYRDEAASAMLLEAMPHAYLVKLGNEWECAANDWHNADSYIFRADRKTCIADAYLAYIQEKRK